MYNKIMVPIDLGHTGQLEKSIATATDLAKQYETPISFVGVTSNPPSEVASTPEEYDEKLKTFGAEQSRQRGIDIDTKTVSSHDVAAELDDLLVDTAKETGADLIVMASHVPGWPEHIFASNAGYVAAHAPVSVFVVR